MATFSKIDGAEPSTVTFRLATVTQDRGGQTQHQEIVTIGGSESTLAVAQVRAAAPASTEFGLVVRIADPSTGAFAISSIAGRTLVDQNSTTWPVQVSSVAGKVLVDQNSTVWQVQVSSLAGAVIVRSSAADLLATVHGNQSSNSSVYLPVRLTNGTAFLTASQDYTDGSTASNLTGPVLTFDNGTNATMRAVSLTLGLPVNVVAGTTNSVLPNSSVATRWFPVQISDGSTWISDSTNRAIRVNVVAGSAAGDTTVSVTPSSSGATRWFPVQVSDGSTWVSDSTNRAIRVNVVAGSVAGDTTATVSFAAGYVSTAAPAANSSALIVRVVDYSTTVNISSGVIRAQAYTSSGGGIEGSTGTPAAGVTGLHVRQVYPTMNSTTAVITSTHSTAIYSLISSVAGLRHKVYAYFVSSTHTNPSTLIFCSSASASGFDHWHVGFGSGSSGHTGANLALPPPGFIFAGVAQNALNVKVEGGSSVTSTCIVRVSVAWFDEA